jgi:hypothetical protein
VCISPLSPTTFGATAQKIIDAVAHVAEKWSALLATTRKNCQIRISPQIRNQMRIYIEVSIRAWADVFHEEKLR